MPLSKSIIIPTYNRDEFLRKCLLSLVRQSYSQNEYEICSNVIPAGWRGILFLGEDQRLTGFYSDRI